MNPFSKEYAEAEIDFMGITEPKRFGRLKIQLESQHPWDYLNSKSFELSRPYSSLYEDQHQWMSLSPIEVQSHVVPIRRAENKVATVGLGLGYFVLRAVEKSAVSSIDVYEVNEEIIEFFKQLHSRRMGFEKINFIVGDAMTTMYDKNYDFVYLDHFPDWRRSVRYLIDWVYLIGANWTPRANYHIWCQEQILMASGTNDLHPVEKAFFNEWKNTTSSLNGKNLQETPKFFYNKNEEVVRLFFEITKRKA
jgi:hypothetical protein